jgi:ketosteroid isomerase-like protein
MEKLIGPLFGQFKQEIHMDIQQLVAEGNRVVAVTSGTTETLDGRQYNNSYCWVSRVQDGKLAAVIEYSDTELITSVFG